MEAFSTLSAERPAELRTRDRMMLAGAAIGFRVAIFCPIGGPAPHNADSFENKPAAKIHFLRRNPPRRFDARGANRTERPHRSNRKPTSITCLGGRWK